MLKILTLLSFLATLCSCSEEDVLITFPPGDYISSCFVSGLDSKKTNITFPIDFKSKVTQTSVYTGVTNCSGPSSVEEDPIETAVSIIFSNEDLGNDVSYLTTRTEKNGSLVFEHIAFQFENSSLYLSTAVDSLGTDPKDTFSNFIFNPAFEAELTLFRKDLNRPLSKK